MYHSFHRRSKLKHFKLFIVVDIVLTLLAVIAVLLIRVIIEGKSLGFVLIGLIILLALNIVFCTFSVRAINRGYGRLISKLWLCVFSIVAFYFLVDFVGGFIFLNKTSSEAPNTVPDKIVHHKMPADSVIRNYAPGKNDVLLRTNNQGFLEISVPKQSDTSKFRILMLGDSFTIGAMVEYDQTACYLVGKYLNKSPNNVYEVINLGVDSYAPVLEYLQLKENIETMRPNMVIMNFDMSDVVHEYVYRQAAGFGPGGEPLAVDGYPDFIKRHKKGKARITNWIYGHMFITTASIEILRKQFGKDVTVESLDLENAVMRENRLLLQHTLKDSGFKEFDRFIAMSEDSILRTKKLCDKYGADFILTTYPWGHQVNDIEWVPGRYSFLPESYEISDRTVDELARFSRENGIPFFNAFPDFRAYNGNELLFYKTDMHFTPTGQNLWAQSLYKFLTNYLDESNLSEKQFQGIGTSGSDK